VEADGFSLRQRGEQCPIVLSCCTWGDPLEGLLEWAKQNRYIRTVSCFEISLYRLEGMCMTETPAATQAP